MDAHDNSPDVPPSAPARPALRANAAEEPGPGLADPLPEVHGSTPMGQGDEARQPLPKGVSSSNCLASARSS